MSRQPRHRRCLTPRCGQPVRDGSTRCLLHARPLELEQQLAAPTLDRHGEVRLHNVVTK